MADDDDVAARRRRVVEVARTFIGTPYHPCGMVKGAGVDCATLIAMTFTEAGEVTGLEVGAYSPQWHLHRRDPIYLATVRKYAHDIEPDKADIGDLVMYRITKLQFAHGAIITGVGPLRIVHALYDARRVLEGDEREFGALAGKERIFLSRW